MNYIGEKTNRQKIVTKTEVYHLRKKDYLFGGIRWP